MGENKIKDSAGICSVCTSDTAWRSLVQREERTSLGSPQRSAEAFLGCLHSRVSSRGGRWRWRSIPCLVLCFHSFLIEMLIKKPEGGEKSTLARERCSSFSQYPRCRRAKSELSGGDKTGAFKKGKEEK